jgi:hypothetical protein
MYERQSMKGWAGPVPAHPPPGGITAPDVASIFAPVAAAPSLPTKPAPDSPLRRAANLELEDDLDSLTAKPASNGNNDSPWKKHLPLAGLFVGGLVCGLVCMKLMGPKSLAPDSASAAPSQPAPSVEPDSARAKAPAKRPVTTVKPEASHDDEESRTANLLALLQTLRTQIELYKRQHNDRLPELSKYPAWAQLTKRTKADGTPAMNGPLGPYLDAPPVNPLNGYAGIGLTRKAPSPGDVMRAEKLGFLFVTTTGDVIATDKDGKTIFDELAARAETKAKSSGSSTSSSASPSVQRPSESPEARLRSAMSILATLRGQVDLYRQQHDRYPDFIRHANWEQFLRKTAKDGSILASPAKESFGPYLAAVPANPLNGNTEVIQVAKLSAYRPSARKIGYVFETSSGKLYATDTMGLPIRE